MKLATILLLAFAVAQEAKSAADKCDQTKCTIKNNCRCSLIDGPLSLDETPQLVVLAFVDAVEEDIYKELWAPLIEARQNPDGDFVSATFYVPHEYTDYQVVHDLATLGFEIGVHSVTNDAHQEYWRTATQELLEAEFGDQRKIISKFANIPADAVVGTLTPQLQLAGDKSINAFVAQGFTYDNSWPAKTSLYPYTLDYASSQSCDNGANCPKESHPGFWVAPIVDLTSEDGDVCATVAACFRERNNQTAQEITNWLVNQVKKVKTSNKAPLTLIVEANLFTSVNESYKGLTDALDTIQKDKDVFLVSQARVIEWMRNPVPLSKFKTAANLVTTGCATNSCTLKKSNGETRYMVSCVPCPKNYPWLNNPEGN